MADSRFRCQEENGFEDVPGGANGAVDCVRIQEVLLEYLGRELSSSAATLVREHLRRCPGCQAEAANLAKVVEDLRAVDPARTAPAILSVRGRRRVLWAWTHPVLAWCVLRHQWVSLFAALLVLLGVFLALRQWRMTQDPPPEGYSVWVRPRVSRTPSSRSRNPEHAPDRSGATGVTENAAAAHASRATESEPSAP